jgi:outer membrane lipoprotein-sorting protein
MRISKISRYRRWAPAFTAAAAAALFLSLPLAGGGKTEAASTKSASLSQQSAALPTVDAILDKYVAAIGGKDAIKGLTSVVQTGIFEAPEPGFKGQVEAYGKLPNKFALKVTIEGFGVVQQVYDGTKGWSSDPASGAREIKGEELAQLQRSSDLHRDIKFHELYDKLTVTGKDKVGNNDTYVVEAVPHGGGKPEKLYFDTSTGFLVRQDIISVSPQGETPTEGYLDDYRDVGSGLKMAFTLRQVTPQISFNIKYSDVKINVPIEDSKFTAPAN